MQEITGNELAEAVYSAMDAMSADKRLTSVEVTIPLTAERTGTYAVARNGAVRRIA